MSYFLALMYLVLVPAVAFSATTGNITLSGTVPAVTSISIAPVAGYNILDLTATQTNTPVANVTEANNTALGYTVTLSSGNSGLLKNGALGTLAYTCKYNGNSAALSSTPVVVTTTSSQNNVVHTVKSLTISYTGISSDNLMQGTYSDTLTFTIIAN